MTYAFVFVASQCVSWRLAEGYRKRRAAPLRVAWEGLYFYFFMHYDMYV